MKRVNGALAFAACIFTALTGGATEPVYINYGVVSNPQIDATTVINYGAISALDPLPFQTASTLNFTNYGSMSGYLGFRFNHKPLQSTNRPAANFVNLNGGTIYSPDLSDYLIQDDGSGWVPTDPLTGEPTCYRSTLYPVKIQISATNIVNRAFGTSGASLITGANGGILMDGQTIDLSGSGLEVQPVWADQLSSGFIGYGDEDRTWFESDVAIYNLAADSTTFNDTFRLETASLWDGLIANAPGIPARNGETPSGSPGFTLPFPYSDYYITWDPESVSNLVVTNITGIISTNVSGIISNVTLTNIVTTNILVPGSVFKGAVFAGVPPGFTADLGFYGGTVDFLRNIGVLISTSITNAVTGGSDPAYIYFRDDLAGETYRGLSHDIVGCPFITSLQAVNARPQNYLMSRALTSPGTPSTNRIKVPPPDFFTSSGSRTNGIPPAIGFDSVTNSVVRAGDVTGYQSFLDNMVSRPPAIPAGTVTNTPGRVSINASGSLDLSWTRIRAEGDMLVTASHLISATNAVLDCENLSFNLTSTNGDLNFDHLSKDYVSRLRGTVTAYSALWSNTVVLIITNSYGLSNVVSTNVQGTNSTLVTNFLAYPNPLTNEIGVTFHTLMLDAQNLQTVLPVTVYDLVTHSTNVVINDNASVVEDFLVDGESLTIGSNSVVQFPGNYPPDPMTGLVPPATALQNWNRSNAPNLLNFTNHGEFDIPISASFGWDGAVPYSRLMNSGAINAYNILINSDRVKNVGTLSASSTLRIQGGSADLFGGQIASGGLTFLQADDIRLNNCQLLSGSTLEISATHSLADAGAGSSNTIETVYGFQLPVKPLAGDLLGTTIRSISPAKFSTVHTWAGEDRGASAVGFKDNVALGTLSLEPDMYNADFRFQGVGAANGLYVDLLDLSQLADYKSQLIISPNLTLYFAASAGVSEEVLDGALGGRLRWVQDFAGPNSSVEVLLANGTTIQTNRALRESIRIDSDNDGLANGYDTHPFDPEMVIESVSVSAGQPGHAQLSWKAAANTVYTLEYSTTAKSSDWHPLLSVTNTAASSTTMTVQDPDPVGGSIRFYRVFFKR